MRLSGETYERDHHDLAHRVGYASSRPALLFIAAALAVGLAYAGHKLFLDLSSIRLGVELPYVLLGIALLIALGFEFVNGFHDTANAVSGCHLHFTLCRRRPP